MRYRLEYDTMGAVEVPYDKYWGAQTQRSLNNFEIGEPASMPESLIYSMVLVKKAAAMANMHFNVLDAKRLISSSRLVMPYSMENMMITFLLLFGRQALALRLI